jgi:hydroxyacylglutathione hydrolase
MKKAQEDSCTTGKSSIGDEKAWNVFMRLDTPEAQYVYFTSSLLRLGLRPRLRLNVMKAR